MNIGKFLQTIYLILGYGLFFVLGSVPAANAQQTVSKESEQIEFANGLFSRGLYEMAIEEYRQFIQDFPQSESLNQAYWAVGESLFLLKSYPQAIEAYDQYINLFPNDSKINLGRIHRAESYFSFGKYDEALAGLNAIPDANLEDALRQIVYFYQAKCHKARQEEQTSIELLKKAAQLVASDYTAQAYIEIGNIYAEYPQYDTAIEFYQQAYDHSTAKEVQAFALYKEGEMRFLADQYEQAVEMFKKVLEQFPEQAIAEDSSANLLLSLFNLGQYDNVITEYQNRQSSIKEDARFFAVFYAVANTYAQMGRFDESIALLEKIMNFTGLTGADQEKIVLKKAEVLIKADRSTKAIKWIESKLDDAAQNKDETLFLKAEAYYGSSEYEKSIEMYQRIMASFPTSPWAIDSLYGLAFAQNALKNFAEAMNSFFQYFEKGKEEAKRQESLYNDIMLALKLEDDQRAINHCDLYLSNFAQDQKAEEVLFILSTLHSKTKNYDKAVELLQQYLQKYPGNAREPLIYFNLAFNLQSSGHNDDALSDYDKIIQMPNVDQKLYYSALKNTAFIFIDQKDNAKAKDVLDRILKEFPQNDLDINIYFWLAHENLDAKNFDETLRILEAAQANQGQADSEGILYFKAEALRGKADCDNAIISYDQILSAHVPNAPASADAGKNQKDNAAQQSPPPEIAAVKNKYTGPAYIGKGLCLEAKKDFEKSKQQFQSAIAQDPNDHTVILQARFEVAQLEETMGNQEEALKQYLNVAILYHDPVYVPQALFRAGTILERLNRKEEAVKAYKEIVSSYQESDLLNKAQERILKLSES